MSTLTGHMYHMFAISAVVEMTLIEWGSHIYLYIYLYLHLSKH